MDNVVSVGEVKWGDMNPIISYTEKIGSKEKTVKGVKIRGQIPHPDFVKAMDSLGNDFLDMMQIRLQDGELLGDRIIVTGLKASESGRVAIRVQLLFDRVKAREYITPSYAMEQLPDAAQRHITRALVEAKRYLKGKSAQTVLKFDGVAPDSEKKAAVS